MGLIDSLRAGYHQGQKKATDEEILKRHAAERKRRQEIRKGQENPSRFAEYFGQAEVKTRGIRSGAKKVGKATGSAAKKAGHAAAQAQGWLAVHYGPPAPSPRRRRKTSKATAPKRKRRRTESRGDDFSWV